ncbi:hypothetical protein ACOJBO_03795 [Rhizobium beringeri]
MPLARACSATRRASAGSAAAGVRRNGKAPRTAGVDDIGRALDLRHYKGPSLSLALPPPLPRRLAEDDWASLQALKILLVRR